ncbi:hypothetical protein THDSLph1_CDS0032 [Terrisporobacter phage TPDSL_ph1]
MLSTQPIFTISIYPTHKSSLFIPIPERKNPRARITTPTLGKSLF